MGQLHWYKRDPDAALSGMMGLSLEERGAYITVLDLIYTRDGKLPDDERFISGWLGADVRVWRRIRARLIDLGKLYIEDDCLRNERADREVLSALGRVVSARNAGITSGASKRGKSKANSNKTSELTQTAVRDPFERPFELYNNHNQITPKSPCEDEGSESVDPPTSKDGKPYAFSGTIIRLNQRDLDAWRSRYHAIPDLTAELWGLDDWLQRQPCTTRKEWFHRVPKALNRKHQELVGKGASDSDSDPLVRKILAQKAREQAKAAAKGEVGHAA